MQVRLSSDKIFHRCAANVNSRSVPFQLAITPIISFYTIILPFFRQNVHLNLTAITADPLPESGEGSAVYFIQRFICKCCRSRQATRRDNRPRCGADPRQGIVYGMARVGQLYGQRHGHAQGGIKSPKKGCGNSPVTEILYFGMIWNPALYCAGSGLNIFNGTDNFLFHHFQVIIPQAGTQTGFPYITIQTRVYGKTMRAPGWFMLRKYESILQF